MLDYLGEKTAAKIIENAILNVLEEGKVRTHDLGGQAKGTEITDAIVAKI